MSLFEFPNNAHFGRVLPKSKIYEYAGASSKLKEFFVRQVDQIIWKYKLAPETINVTATTSVPEIQIFTIVLKTRDLKEDVLRSIDKAIPFPIIYELSFGKKIKVMAAHKRPSESDSGKWVVGSYFATDWLASTSDRKALPVTLDLSVLYQELLRSVIPYPTKAKETLHEHLVRAEAITSMETELAKTEAILSKEKQFNRKVEINAKIRTIKKDIEKLTSGKGA